MQARNGKSSFRQPVSAFQPLRVADRSRQTIQGSCDLLHIRPRLAEPPDMEPEGASWLSHLFEAPRKDAFSKQTSLREVTLFSRCRRFFGHVQVNIGINHIPAANRRGLPRASFVGSLPCLRTKALASHGQVGDTHRASVGLWGLFARNLLRPGPEACVYLMPKGGIERLEKTKRPHSVAWLFQGRDFLHTWEVLPRSTERGTPLTIDPIRRQTILKQEAGRC